MPPQTVFRLGITPEYCFTEQCWKPTIGLIFIKYASYEHMSVYFFKGIKMVRSICLYVCLHLLRGICAPWDKKIRAFVHHWDVAQVASQK